MAENTFRTNVLTEEGFRNKAFFNVHEVDAAYNVNGQWVKSPDKKTLVRDDFTYVSTVGKNYSIVDNQKFFNTVIETLTEGQIQWVAKSVYVEGNGRRTNMVVSLPQFKMYQDGELIDMELRIRNSFDTTLAAVTQLGWLRLVCTNGMTTFNDTFKFSMRHKGDIASKAEEAINLYKGFDEVWKKDKEVIEWLGNSYGEKDKIKDYIGDGELTNNPILKGERWSKRLLNAWESKNCTSNLYDIYNIFTEAISHDYGKNYSGKITKLEALNKDVAVWNRRFNV